MVSSRPSADGNDYELTQTIHGVPTLRHKTTGELLHSQAGPFQEAMQLYVQPSGLLQLSGEVVVFDCGLGAASLTLGVRSAWLQNRQLTKVTCVSFDLEKSGIAMVLNHLDQFEFAKPHQNFLKNALQFDQFEEEVDGRKFIWKFVSGDFSENCKTSFADKADIIFWDFFSPGRHGHLWSSDVAKALFENSNDDSFLVTFSAATGIRANLLAAGFYVGFGVSSGQKSTTTFAAKRSERIERLIPKAWVKAFLTTRHPFVEIETEESRKWITERILQHPQFV